MVAKLDRPLLKAQMWFPLAYSNVPFPLNKLILIIVFLKSTELTVSKKNLASCVFQPT